MTPKRLPTTLPPPAAEPFMVETRPLVPGAERVESHLFVPVGQTLFSAFLLGITVLAFEWRAGAGWFMVAIDAIWFIRIFGHEVVFVLERLLRRDIDGDTITGKPPTPKPGFVVNGWSARHAMIEQEVRANQESLIAFWYLCASYAKPTEEALDIPPDDRENFAAYRDQLIQAGVAAWDNPAHHRAGWHLVGKAEDAARILHKHVV